MTVRPDKIVLSVGDTKYVAVPETDLLEKVRLVSAALEDIRAQLKARKCRKTVGDGPPAAVDLYGKNHNIIGWLKWREFASPPLRGVVLEIWKHWIKDQNGGKIETRVLIGTDWYRVWLPSAVFVGDPFEPGDTVEICYAGMRPRRHFKVKCLKKPA